MQTLTEFFNQEQKLQWKKASAICVLEQRLSETNTLTPFGTLGAAFEITESPELNAPFPKDCLTY